MSLKYISNSCHNSITSIFLLSYVVSMCYRIKYSCGKKRRCVSLSWWLAFSIVGMDSVMDFTKFIIVELGRLRQGNGRVVRYTNINLEIPCLNPSYNSICELGLYCSRPWGGGLFKFC